MLYVDGDGERFLGEIRTSGDQLECRFDDIMALPPPIGKLQGTEIADLRRMADYFYRVVLGALKGEQSFPAEPVEYICSTCTAVHQVSQKIALDRLVMQAGTYYSEVAGALASIAPDEFFDIPGCSVEAYDFLHGLDCAPSLDWAQRLFLEFIGVIQGVAMILIARARGAAGEALADSSHRILSKSILGVMHVFMKSIDTQGRYSESREAVYLMRCMLSVGIHLQADVSSRVERPWNLDHRSGVFSSMNLPELSLLANREVAVVNRYGDSRVEKLFEQQLALLAQSFGFYVTPTRTGEATVDLICISGDPSAQYTFLMEAKSSSRQYALPMDDRRALLDYVADVRENLTTTPELAFVLIVGGKPHKSLARRLVALELECKIPIRFCSAQTLAELRENVVGSVPLSVLRRYILAAGPVLDRASFIPLLEEIEARHAAQRDLVRTFLRGADGAVRRIPVRE